MNIFSRYDEFRYIYPPRPVKKIQREHLDHLDDDWIAQPKYNGCCSALFIKGTKEYILCNRTAGKLYLQKPINFTALNDGNKFMVLCGEYLNKNQKGEQDNSFNHKFIIWDILVWRGTYLIGETFETRLNILYELFGKSNSHVTDKGILMFNYLHVTKVENVYIAPTFENDFKLIYDDLIKTDLYEGLVLKNLTGKLELGFNKRNNEIWQLKARR